MAEMALPITQAAVYHAALTVREHWIVVAERREAAETYIAGLSRAGSIIYPGSGDKLAAAVVNLARDASLVEEGRPGLHLPSVIRWGQTPKSRRSTKGVWYIIVPFRHGTPGTQAGSSQMPRRVYAVARQLQFGQSLTAGPTQGSRLHAPGLTPYQPRNPLNQRPGARTSIHEGLRRVPGKGKSGSYVSLRVMTQNSPGWNMPARPGLHVAAQTVREVTPEVTRIIEAAIRQDMLAAVQQRLGR